MRLIFAIVVLATSAYAANAKDWDQMNGREKRLYVGAYVAQNNLICNYHPMQESVQEEELAKRSWLAVAIGMKLYCSQGSATQQATMKK